MRRRTKTIRPSRSAPARLSDIYEPFPRQKQFHTSPAKYRLFGGAAGPGKTKALLWEAIFQALHNPGADTLLLRRTYPELESSLLAYFRRDVPRSAYKKYNEAKHIVTWKNGSTTRFGYCRNENDVYRYQGAEFLFIGLDELTHFTLKQWQFLTSRNRCPIPGTKSCMAGASNPGNIGHAWVKALWVDHQPPATFERADLYDPRDYDFIRARIFDNPIYANDIEYRRTLETLPEHLRRAFLDGDWNVFAGQYFDIFDYGRHTARPEELRLEAWWPRWISIDWGFQHPSAVYWHCAVPAQYVSRSSWPVTRDAPSVSPTEVESPKFKVEGRTESFPNEPASLNFEPSTFNSPHGSRNTNHEPRIITYREFVQNGLSPRMLAQAIAERSGREAISEVFLSPDAFAHRTSEASIAEQLGDVLLANGLPRPAPADDDRIGGWQFLYQLLEADAWVIAENCAKLIECLPTLVRDNSNIEDIRKMDGDDPADSARYGLVSGAGLAGVGAAAFGGRPGATQESPPFGATGAPACARDAARNVACDGARGVGARFIVPSSGAANGGARFSASPGASPSGTPRGASPVGAGFSPSHPAAPRFVTGMPLNEQIARQISATDPTSVAIHSQRLEREAQKHFRPKKLPRRRH